MKGLIALLLAANCALTAHEGGRKNPKPTNAGPDLKMARQRMDAAKKKLVAQGKYSCCVKPSCDLCARVNGSCACAINVAKGLGACGECFAGWRAGRGAVKGVSKDSVRLLPAEKQAMPAKGEASPELMEAMQALVRAKKTLIAEKRYSCCVRGGCDECAHEAECPCGADLAKSAGKGVCGQCLDGWHAGHGSFPGVSLSEVKLAKMETMSDGMGPGVASSGVYSSGTSQVPRISPQYMLHRSFGGWDVMLGGVVFGIYSDQSGPRGRDKTWSSNWIMPMASRRLGPGTLTLRSMFSLEPWTVTGRRYPLLFQMGETAYGIPIINGQHPHDFFMELAASYNIRMGERASVSLYGGPRGDPALGPPAFPHRISNSENPIAVLSHHYQDSTHISTNVVTAGATYGPVTLEVSGFHGREPDEGIERWKLTGGAIDSFATRLTFNPSSRWSGQISVGRINNREATHPLRDSFRQSASLTYVRPFTGGHWASSLVWGRNHDLAFTALPGPLPVFNKSRKDHVALVPTRVPGQIYNSYLAESTMLLRNKNWVWGRVESADKDSLLLFEEDPFVRLVEEQRYTRVQAYTVGYERELPRMVNWLSTGIGGQVTLFHAPANLELIYGSNPVGVQVFLRLRPAQ